MPALFDLISIRVLSLQYDRPDVEDPTHEGKISFEPSIQQGTEDESLFRYVLSVNVSGAFNIKVETESIFKSNNQLAKPDEEELALFQVAFATTVPYVRAYLSSVTSFDGRSPFTLPLVNIKEIMLEADEPVEEEVSDS